MDKLILAVPLFLVRWTRAGFLLSGKTETGPRGAEFFSQSPKLQTGNSHYRKWSLLVVFLQPGAGFTIPTVDELRVC